MTSLGDVLGIVGLLVGVASNGVSYYLYVRTFANKGISSYIRSTASIEPFDARTLSSGVLAPLRYADCTVWNSGRQTIFGSELKSENGIEISLSEDAEIFKGPIVQASLRENAVEARRLSLTRVSCRFDYLDPGQGFMITIAYAIPTPDFYEPKFEVPKIAAVVVGMPQGINTAYPKSTNY